MFVSRIAGFAAFAAFLFAQSASAAPLPNVADLVDVAYATPEIEGTESGLVKRAGEEFFFRFEDPAVLKAGVNILPLATRQGSKDFDDQAYKFISTNAATADRTPIPKRLATIYVLPAGTRAAIAAAAKDFETEKTAKRATDFVTKTNEPGDVGINGVANGGKALSDFRAKVIRTVIKQTSASAGGKVSFVTITKGKTSKTATAADQKALARFN